MSKSMSKNVAKLTCGHLGARILTALKLFFKREVDIRSVATVVMCGLLLAPMVVVFAGMTEGGVEWSHIRSTVLPQ